MKELKELYAQNMESNEQKRVANMVMESIKDIIPIYNSVNGDIDADTITEGAAILASDDEG